LQLKPDMRQLETLRTGRIKNPAQVDLLLDDFVRHRGIVPESATRIIDTEVLPAELQALLPVAGRAGQSWAGWADDDHHLWLFTAEMLLLQAGGNSVLQVHLYREDGNLKDSGLWVSDQDGCWQQRVT
jgi:hypothetical protein